MKGLYYYVSEIYSRSSVQLNTPNAENSFQKLKKTNIAHLLVTIHNIRVKVKGLARLNNELAR